MRGELVLPDGYELSAHEEALADEDLVWFTVLTADSLMIREASGADGFTVQLQGVDANVLQFSDIPDPHHGLAENEIDRTAQREPANEIFEKWVALESASTDAFELHALNAAFTLHKDDGTRSSVVLALHQLTDYDPESMTVTFDARALPGETIEPGEFVDISILVDGWVDVVFWCGAEIVGLAAAAMAEAATAGAATPLVILGLTTLTYNCLRSLYSMGLEIAGQ